MTTVSASAEGNEDGLIVFAFDYPGACGWGPTEATAIDRLRTDLAFTGEWLAAHGFVPDPFEPIPVAFDVDVTERVPATGNPLQCDSEGFFDVDRRPYDDADVAATRALLAASRSDLNDLAGGLPGDVLDRRLLEDRRTVREILDHVALAEHWYATRVAHAARVDVPHAIPDDWNDYPAETFDRLAAIRNDVVGWLGALERLPGERRGERWVVDGEQWSIAKVLRRFAWHELLHYKQLVGLVPKVDDGSRR